MSVIDLFKLNGKVALVTGASKGLGKAMALALADVGADVLLFARSDMSDIKNAIEGKGSKAFAVRGDVTKEEDVTKAVDAAVQELGGLDILVNNAGIVEEPQMVHELPTEQWESAINVDVTGTFFFSREALKIMVKQKSGKIINISSIWGFTGSPMFPGIGYCTSKGAVINFTKELAKQYAEYGINVNCIAPGFFKTDVAGGVYHDKEFMASAMVFIPMKRIAEPDELAGTVVFLASDAANYMTGSIIVVDGGYLTI